MRCSVAQCQPCMAWITLWLTGLVTSAHAGGLLSLDKAHLLQSSSTCDDLETTAADCLSNNLHPIVGTECQRCLGAALPSDVGGCGALDNALCPALRDCPCAPCRSELRSFLRCALEQVTGCDLDCRSFASGSAFPKCSFRNEQWETCLTTNNLTTTAQANCRNCIQQEWPRDMYAAGCKEWETSACFAQEICDCGPCGGQHEALYECLIPLASYDDTCALDCDNFISPTVSPTARPSRAPTPRPSPPPTRAPTAQPTRAPTPRPSPRPTRQPFSRPTSSPTISPKPTVSPTRRPTLAPTRPPTPRPTSIPSRQPSPRPSPRPTVPPPVSLSPTLRPTQPPVTTAPSPSPRLFTTTPPTTTPPMATGPLCWNEQYAYRFCFAVQLTTDERQFCNACIAGAFSIDYNDCTTIRDSVCTALVIDCVEVCGTACCTDLQYYIECFLPANGIVGCTLDDCQEYRWAAPPSIAEAPVSAPSRIPAETAPTPGAVDAGTEPSSVPVVDQDEPRGSSVVCLTELFLYQNCLAMEMTNDDSNSCSQCVADAWMEGGECEVVRSSVCYAMQVWCADVCGTCGEAVLSYMSCYMAETRDDACELDCDSITGGATLPPSTEPGFGEIPSAPTHTNDEPVSTEMAPISQDCLFAHAMEKSCLINELTDQQAVRCTNCLDQAFLLSSDETDCKSAANHLCPAIQEECPCSSCGPPIAAYYNCELGERIGEQCKLDCTGQPVTFATSSGTLRRCPVLALLMAMFM